MAVSLPGAVGEHSDTSGFDALFDAEQGPMLRLAVSLVDTAERAEEIVQDAFERTLLAWRRLEHPGAYLRTCVVNGCRSELRRRRVTRRTVVPVSAESTSTSDEYLLDAVAKLTPKRRIAVTLRFYEGLSDAQIAAVMGVRVGTVKSLVSRGLADLRKADLR